MPAFGTRQLNAWASEYEKSEDMRKDRKITLAVLDYKPALAEFCSDEFKDDEEIALAAVRREGRTLRFFSQRVRSSKTVVAAAVNNYCRSYSYALGEAAEDRDIALAVARSGSDAIKLLPRKFLDDREAATLATDRNPRAIIFFSERLRSDPKLAVKVLIADRTAVSLLGDEAFEDDEVFRLAARPTGSVIGANVLFDDSPAALFRAIDERELGINVAQQKMSVTSLDREKLIIVLRRAVGDIPRRAELFRKQVEADDAETVSFMTTEKPCPPSLLSEMTDYAAKNRKIRVLPVLLNAQKKCGKTDKQSGDARALVVRSLKRGSLQGVKRFLANYEELKDDRETVYLAVKTDGRLLPEIKTSRFFGENELTDLCLENYIVKNSDEPILKKLPELELTKKQVLLAVKRDGRNYYYLKDDFKKDKDVVAEAIRTEKGIYDLIPDDYKADEAINRNYRL